MITLVSGGARSGKSRFAEKIAWSRGGPEVFYLATSEIIDEEMEARVKKHVQDRPDEWETIEEPYRVSRALSGLATGSVVLLDCITVLVSNLLLKGEGAGEDIDPVEKERQILAEIQLLVETVGNKNIDLIIVTNEVGQGLVPDYKLGRIFRDITGRVNQFLAGQADEVYVTFAGLPVEIKQIGIKNIEKFEENTDN